MRQVITALRFAVFLALPIFLSAQSCPDSSQVSVQKLSPLPSSDGCSVPSGLRVEGAEDFTYCCDHHDACYSTCGIERQTCEDDFKKCMIDLCQTVFTNNTKCESAANTYSMGTSLFGINGFQMLQNQYCECVDEAKATDRYKTILSTNMIKALRDNGVNSEQIEGVLSKIQAELEKNPSVSQLSALFYGMLKANDAAISHEGTRVGKNPPKPKSLSEFLLQIMP